LILANRASSLSEQGCGRPDTAMRASSGALGAKREARRFDRSRQSSVAPDRV